MKKGMAFMDKSAILAAAANYVQDEFGHDSSGHDWWHMHRVAATARKIAREENANEFVCELAALLHDIADEKFNESEEEGIAKVEIWLHQNKVEQEVVRQIVEIIATMSYKGGHRPPMRTLEGQIVQDADRLDAIGAIGISRVFAYSGAHGRPIHDPDRLPRREWSPEQYRSGEGTAIHHFYEKLLKLKDMMNTQYAKRIAEERHQYMESFLHRFYSEWEGDK
jgi:uncharacterized protein